MGDYLPAPGPLAVPFDKKDGDVIKEIFATWSRAVYGRPAIVFRALAVFWTFAKKRNASTAGEESPSASAMGYACLLIATNINHDLTARREIFDDISDTAKDVTACMFHVLKVLDFDLAIPSPFEILLKYYYGPNENIVGDDGEMQYAKAAIDLALAYALPETALLVSPKDLVLGALIAHSGSRPVIDENRADVRYAPNIRAAERVIKTAHANISRIAWLKEIAEDVMDGLNVPATTVDQLVSTFLTS